MMSYVTRAPCCALLAAALLLCAACADAARALEQNGRRLAQGQSAEHRPKLVHFINGVPPDTPQPDFALLAPLRAAASQGYAKSGSGGMPAPIGISYYKGPVMTAAANNVYVIWYGDWSAANTAYGTGGLLPGAQTTILSFLSNLGASPWFKINTQYYDGGKLYVKPVLNVAGKQSVGPYLGKSLSEAQVAQVVTDALGTSVPDKNGVYLVLTSPDVTVVSSATSAFCTQYCGWHTYVPGYNGVDTKFAFIGNTARCPTNCTMNPAAMDPSGAHGMVNVIAHEVSEAVTDPNLNAWMDVFGRENADKCGGKFGTTYTAADGRTANSRLGDGVDYLVQQNWSPVVGGCVSSV